MQAALLKQQQGRSLCAHHQKCCATRHAAQRLLVASRCASLCRPPPPRTSRRAARVRVSAVAHVLLLLVPRPELCLIHICRYLCASAVCTGSCRQCGTTTTRTRQQWPKQQQQWAAVNPRCCLPQVSACRGRARVPWAQRCGAGGRSFRRGAARRGRHHCVGQVRRRQQQQQVVGFGVGGDGRRAAPDTSTCCVVLCSYRLLGEAAAGVDGDTSAVLLCNRLEQGAVTSIAGRPAAAEAPSRSEQLMLVLQPGATAAVYEVIGVSLRLLLAGCSCTTECIF